MTGNVDNVREFNLALDQFIKQQVPEDALAAQQQIALNALAGVVKKSPVDTGRFRANWHLSTVPTDAPVTTAEPVLPSTATDEARAAHRAAHFGREPSGGTRAQSEADVANAEPYGTIYLQNNLPYAGPLETGTSQQAPSGVLALTLAELQSQIVGDLE